MQYIPIWEKDAWDDGYGKGKEERNIEIVKIMLQKGTDINLIASLTDIPIEEIKQLAVETPLTQVSQ